MKLIFVLFALLVASVSGGGDRGQMMKVVKECAEESKVKLPDLMAAWKNSDPVPENIGCAISCIGIKLKMLKEDGSVNEDVVKTFKSGKLKKIGDLLLQCSSSVKGADKCKKGKSLLDCLKSKGLGKTSGGDDD